jgi:hypothetical protein
MPGAHDRPAIVLAGCLLALFSTAVRAGTLQVRLSPADGVRAVQAVDRESGETHVLEKSASDDPKVAVFEHRELPIGVYNCVLLTHKGRIEGADLRLADVAEDAPELRERDVAEITKLVMGMTSFADRRRVLFLRGRGAEARVLVEELTTRKTTLPSSTPFVVWRVEVWSYRKEFGAWDRYRSDVVARERPSVSAYRDTTWVFEPTLGGLALNEEASTVEVSYEIPAELNPKHGLVAGKNTTK